MSFRPDKFLRYKETGQFAKARFLEKKSEEDIKNLFLEILYDGVHGFCYSLYEEGQKPGDIISEDQIRRRMLILKPYTRWIRSFSCIEGNELIPVIAKELGINTLVGAWLGKDEEKNQQEIRNLIKLSKDGFVDIAAVGNEVLYRHDLSEDQLIDVIQTVKNSLTGIPVGYVDAYYEFVKRPRLSELCDVILCNCYPFWEGTDFNDSFQHLQYMYHQAKMAANGKRVVITETGWPSRGENLGNAVPSQQSAIKYFINTQLWSIDEGIEVFYFASFDESWKVSAEGEVGAYWGIWDKNERLKFSNEHL